MTTSNERPRDDLPARSVRALAWNYAGTAARAVAQLAITVVLARLLGPEEFGTVAIGWLVVGLGTLVADLGLGVVLVQRPSLSPADVRFSCTMQLALGALLCAATVAGAGAIAGWFGHPSAAPVVRAMSLLFLLQSVSATPLALMRRELDFRTTQLIAVLSYLVGYVGVGIPAAVAGAGAWSLVAAQLVQSTLSMGAALLRSPQPFRLSSRPADRSLVALGAKVVGTNLVNWGLANADALVVGRVLGADALGIYGRAAALAQSPATALTTSLQGVLFAACSRAQNDHARLRKAYLATTGALASVVLPVFVTVACVAATAVEALYGARWSAAAPVLTPFALATAVGSLGSLPGPVLGAVNRFETELRAQLAALVVMAPAVVAGSAWGPAGVAWAVFLVRMAQLAALSRAVTSSVGGEGAAVAQVLRWPLAAAVTTASVTTLVDRAVAGAPALARLGLDALVAACALALCLRAFGRRWTSDGGFRSALPVASLPVTLRGWLVEPDAADGPAERGAP